ncbi:MAG: CpsB/CapC family capsule biosynthesis tyrosine phosphatase [Candidatus Fimimorpha sp.]
MQNYCADIHCHMLPRVDDGAESFEESIKMLNIALKEGIRTICLTPHYMPERWKPRPEKAREYQKYLQRYARQFDPNIKIYLGNELFYRQGALEDLNKGNCLTLNGSRYVLVEFSPVQPYQEIYKGLNYLISGGYTPILAHIERYIKINTSLDKAEELRQRGILIQVNASSVLGGSGNTAKKFAKKLLKKNLVHVICTDAHSCRHRAPHMSECMQYVAKHYGDEYAQQLFCKNPENILYDKKVGEL